MAGCSLLCRRRNRRNRHHTAIRFDPQLPPIRRAERCQRNAHGALQFSGYCIMHPFAVILPLYDLGQDSRCRRWDTDRLRRAVAGVYCCHVE